MNGLHGIYMHRLMANLPERDELSFPLCLQAMQDNCTVQLTAVGDAPSVSLEYSTDNSTWNTYTVGTTIALQHYKDRVYFKGSNSTFGTSHPTSNVAYHRFALTGLQRASGNIMSLVDPTLESTAIPERGCFRSLFRDNTTLLTPPAMPATTLKATCYHSIYYGCSLLQRAPVLPSLIVPDNAYGSAFRESGISVPPELPATQLGNGCYTNLFYRCPKLLFCPELPAKTMPTSTCYEYMCYGCLKLKKGPSILPATTSTAGAHYRHMFSGCSDMQEFPLILASDFTGTDCFRYMFNNCTNASGTVELHMTALKGNNYMLGMFRNCKALKGVKVHFTDWSNGYTDATSNWFEGASTTGTFTCPVDLDTTTITRNASTIPVGWTISKY